MYCFLSGFTQPRTKLRKFACINYKWNNKEWNNKEWNNKEPNNKNNNNSAGQSDGVYVWLVLRRSVYQFLIAQCEMVCFCWIQKWFWFYYLFPFFCDRSCNLCLRARGKQGGWLNCVSKLCVFPNCGCSKLYSTRQMQCKTQTREMKRARERERKRTRKNAKKK